MQNMSIFLPRSSNGFEDSIYTTHALLLYTTNDSRIIFCEEPIFNGKGNHDQLFKMPRLVTIVFYFPHKGVCACVLNIIFHSLVEGIAVRNMVILYL